MFHIYNYATSGFQEWLRATNQLYYSKYLALGGRKKEYRPLQVNAYPQDQFLLYIDDEAGICGSAAITALPYNLEINDQLVPQGTWILRNVFFHLRPGHFLQKQLGKSRRIIEQFHLGLFQHLWDIAQRSDHKVALSLQNDLEIHKDLVFFGGFTFTSELMEQEEEISVAMAVMDLTSQTYDMYQQKRQAPDKIYPWEVQDPKEVYVPFFLPKIHPLKPERSS